MAEEKVLMPKLFFQGYSVVMVFLGAASGFLAHDLFKKAPPTTELCEVRTWRDSGYLSNCYNTWLRIEPPGNKHPSWRGILTTVNTIVGGSHNVILDDPHPKKVTLEDFCRDGNRRQR